MKKSIKKKLMLFFMVVLVIPMILTFAFAESSVAYLKGRSETLLVNEALDSANSFTKEKAVTINGQLDTIIKNLKTMREFTELIYQNENKFLKQPMKTPDEFSEDVKGKTIHWLPCNKESDTAALKSEAALLSNLEPVFEATGKNCSAITSIYVTTKTGLNIGYDENVLAKKGLGYYEPRLDKSWYLEPVKNNTLYISNTYSDSFGRGLMVTISLPYHVDGAIRGTITADINIEEINEEILDIAIGNEGYAMLFSDKGSLISAKGITETNKNAEDFLGENNKEVLASISKKESAVNKSSFSGKEVYIIHNKVANTGWKLAVVLPVTEIIAPAQQSNTTIFIISMLLIGFYLIIIFIMMYSVKKICVKITSPIIDLTEHAKIIGDGNLDYTSKIDTGDEIQVLSESFESMTLSIKEYIENLSKVTAEKERIGAELDVATKIQASMLPCIFPAFPDRAEFDIYASMLPAKEVGGDFYDFFLIDEDHLGIVIADVSGKGVPAALFMVIAKTLIKNNAQYGKTPKAIFETVNNQLCENNEAGMFVTAFMGILEISTGKFTYVNAGHNPPIIKKADGDFEWLPTKPGFVLAGMEDMFYKQDEVILNKGDILYMYTDGVTEAVNKNDDLFAEPRLLSVINTYKSCALKEILVSVKQEIDIFADGAEQADDITMLALKMNERDKFEK